MTEQPAHEQKRQLIETIHAEALRMQGIDERESMTLMTVAEVMEYYDQLLPHTKDAQVILAAVEAEIYIRRSERIAQEPERRGGDHQSKVTPGVTLPDAAKMARSRMRIVGKNATAARAYVNAQVKANHKATRKGIVRHVKQAAGNTTKLPSKAARRSGGSGVAGQWAGRQTRMARESAHILATLERLADGTRRTDLEIYRITGIDVLKEYLKRIRLIPWLTIDRTLDGTVFTIDQDLREICERRVPRPALDGGSIRDFLAHLRSEMQRRRKENRDAAHAVKWNSDTIIKREQSDLLDWVEDQLGRIS